MKMVVSEVLLPSLNSKCEDGCFRSPSPLSQFKMSITGWISLFEWEEGPQTNCQLAMITN